MKKTTFISIFTTFLLFFLTSFIYAQRPTQSGGEEIIMLEEIRIEVTPELPTVVVTIPRQKPEVKSTTLQKDIESLLTVGTNKVKPRLTDMTVSKVEDLQKILTKERNK